MYALLCPKLTDLGYDSIVLLILNSRALSLCSNSCNLKCCDNIIIPHRDAKKSECSICTYESNYFMSNFRKTFIWMRSIIVKKVIRKIIHIPT